MELTAEPTRADWPIISILMPVRNEAAHIEGAVKSVATNGYPLERMEILVIDGESDDATAGIIARLVDELPIRVLPNPGRIVPTALNIGLRAAKGEIIYRLDGHASFYPGYLQRTTDFLRCNPGYDCAGAPIHTISLNQTGQAIALAQSSPFGVGDSRFRIQGYRGEVDSLAFGGYRRQVFDKVGGYDEELVRNQDDEFNYRMRRHGLRLWMEPEAGTRYQARSSFRQLWRQYLQYGFWKIRVMQKLGKAPLRSLVPLLFVGALVSGAVAMAWSLLPLALLLTAYLSFLGAAAYHGKGQSPVLRLRKVWAIVILHLAYGLGEITGIARFVLGVRAIKPLTRSSRQVLAGMDA